MEKYDFRFQVWTGALLIIWACFFAIGVSSPTIQSDVGPGAPLWASLLSVSLVLPGIFFCAYAYWRARKRSANLGLFFLCLAAYFGIAIFGMYHEEPEPDEPSAASLIVGTVAFGVVGVALFAFDYILARRFGRKPVLGQASTIPPDSFTEPSAAWKIVLRIGRLLLFLLCLFITRVIVSPRFVQQDWPRVALFVVVLLLSCVVSGLIPVDVVPKFLSFLNVKLKIK